MDIINDPNKLEPMLIEAVGTKRACVAMRFTHGEFASILVGSDSVCASVHWPWSVLG